MPDMNGAIFGWEKVTQSSFKKMFIYIERNGRVVSMCEDSPATIRVGATSFNVTFKVSAASQGKYYCVYNHLPHKLRSNTTSITVKG